MKIKILEWLTNKINRFNGKMTEVQAQMLINKIDTGSPFVKKKEETYKFDPTLTTIWEHQQK